MEKKVFVISRHGCQICEILEYELKYIHNIEFSTFSNSKTPEIFLDFQKQFKIDRFPVVQIDNGKEFTTIHWDSEFTEIQSGNPGGKQPFPHIKVNNIEEMINKTLKLLSE